MGLDMHASTTNRHLTSSVDLSCGDADQVTRVRHILEGLGLDIATPDEAREILSLKGGDAVGF